MRPDPCPFRVSHGNGFACRVKGRVNQIVRTTMLTSGCVPMSGLPEEATEQNCDWRSLSDGGFLFADSADQWLDRMRGVAATPSPTASDRDPMAVSIAEQIEGGVYGREVRDP